MTEIRLSQLIDRYLNEVMTDPEREELARALEEDKWAAQAKEIIGDFLEKGEFNYEPDLEELYARIDAAVITDRRPVRIIQLLRWVAAAVLIGLMAVGGWLVLGKRNSNKEQRLVVKTDVKAPAANRAMITLSNGKTVYLNSITAGQLANEGEVQVIKLADGRIAYSGNAAAMKYNTLTNPRGSTVIDMAFSDGSHVWLNAGSSVTYPVAFTDNERNVTLSGEAYFEVAKDASRPFTVSKADMKVTVLGTHFNVNAYDDEADIKVTLLEGSVRVNQGASKETIQPGQQAVVKKEGIKVNREVDTEEVMAWKNGYLQFDNADLQAVMRQLARWYDVEIIYQGEVPKRQFAGELQRDLNLSQMLRILETNNVHFKIEEGRKLLVSD